MAAKRLAVAIAFTLLGCGDSGALHPIDDPAHNVAGLPPFTHTPVVPNDPPPSETPPQQTTPCNCAATTNDGCSINGRCDDAGACIYDTAAAHTACTDDAGRAGECIGESCIAWDMQTYGTPPEPTPTWCPLSGVGLPAEQRLHPVPGAGCTIIGGGEQAYGTCPSDPANIQSFADVDLTTYAQRNFDLRWLKFAGVESLRFVLPAQPSLLTFMITDFAWGGDIPNYKISISDTPCAVNQVDTEYDMHHCEAPGRSMVATIGYSDPVYTTTCTALLPGHAYYLNIYGDGPADPGGDGVIDAGDRLLIDIRFDRPPS